MVVGRAINSWGQKKIRCGGEEERYSKAIIQSIIKYLGKR